MNGFGIFKTLFLLSSMVTSVKTFISFFGPKPTPKYRERFLM